MSFFEKISPFKTPEFLAQKGDLFILREKILQSLLLFFIIGGFPSTIIVLVHAIQSQQYSRAGLYILFYGFVIYLAFLRRLPYNFRGYILTSMTYLMALSELFESMEMSDVRVLLVGYISLTAILFHYRSVIVAVVISLATVAIPVISVSFFPNQIPLLANLDLGADWVTSSILFFLVSALITGSITIVISSLGNNLVKQAELAQRLEHERSALEDRIHERTRSMARRMVQQRAAAEISRTISALSDPETMMQQVVNLIKENFDLYYVGVFLIDSSRQYAVLRAGTGDAGKKMISLSHQLAIGGSSMIGWSITNRKPIIALDVGEEAVRFNNPHLPLTRSEMALPIIAHDYVIGAMTIQSDQANAFDENDISILENIVDGLAIALENDRLYHETRKSLDEIRMLNHEYLQRAWAETLETYGELSYNFENPNLASETPAQNANSVELPLLLRDEVIGTITLEMDRTELTADETTFVENVTTQAAIALENARLLHETERRAMQEQKLNELAARFSRALTIDEILRAAAQELGQLPTVAEVSVQLNPAGQANRTASLSGLVGSGNGKEHKS